jgi:hypothetical protein
MDADGIIAVAVFFFFLVWAVSFYYTTFGQQTGNFAASAAEIQNKILDHISSDAYKIPVEFYTENATDVVLYAKLAEIPNSTTIHSGDDIIDCEIDGNNIYWSASLSSGYSYFTIEYFNETSEMICTADFSADQKSAANQTISWSAEKYSVFSTQKLDEMEAADYDIFKQDVGVSEDFRLEFSGGLNLTYGRSVPSNRDVQSIERTGRLDTDQYVNVTLMVW